MANWYYYDEYNARIQVESAAKLKELALSGVILPDTVIENEAGKKSVASKIQGLKFGEKILNEPANVYELNSPEVASDIPVSEPMFYGDLDLGDILATSVETPQSESNCRFQPTKFFTGMDSNILFMFMHFFGLVFFPMMVFLWVAAKDSEKADTHGKIIINWYLSAVIYLIVWSILNLIITVCLSSMRPDIHYLDTDFHSKMATIKNLAFLASIPYFCLLVFVIVSIVFWIMAMVKAANGKIWRYPFSLPFFFRVNI
jgi:uncharacterized Tic20 family protein